jgi:hypothetical protein
VNVPGPAVCNWENIFIVSASSDATTNPAYSNPDFFLKKRACGIKWHKKVGIF